MNTNEQSLSEITKVLLKSDLFSMEQKFDLQENGFYIKDGKFCINKGETILPSKEAANGKSNDLLKSTSDKAIEIPKNVLELGLKYANYKISQRKWAQELYRMAKSSRNLSHEATENEPFKRTMLKKLGMLTTDSNYHALQEKSRRNNQRMVRDGLLTIKTRRKKDLEHFENRKKRNRTNPGRYTSNKYAIPETAFQLFELLNNNKVLYSQPKEIAFFLKTGTKLQSFKKAKKNEKGGVSNHKRWSMAEGIYKDLNKEIVRNDKPLSNLSSSSFFKKSQKAFSKDEINLSKIFKRRLLEELALTEHPTTLKLQARKLLEHNNGDLKKTRAHHERILAEHKKQHRRKIIQNDGAWRQTAIDRGIELNGEIKPIEKEKNNKKKFASTPNPLVKATRNQQLREIHQAIQILPRRAEINSYMPSKWLAIYKDPKKIQDAIWVAYERHQHSLEIQNLEAYITALIKKGAKPQRFNLREHEIIEKNKLILKEKFPQLQAKEITVSVNKVFREKREFYQLKFSRKKACGHSDFLEIAFCDPNLGEMIKNFEKKQDEEKKNIPENQSWMKETIKSLSQENQDLKIKEIQAGYRLYIKVEEMIGNQKSRFMDHIDLYLSNPKPILKSHLNDFVKRHQLTARIR